MLNIGSNISEVRVDGDLDHEFVIRRFPGGVDRLLPLLDRNRETSWRRRPIALGFGGLGLGTHLVRLVASLLQAWVLINLFSGLVRDPFWSTSFATSVARGRADSARGATTRCSSCPATSITRWPSI